MHLPSSVGVETAAAEAGARLGWRARGAATGAAARPVLQLLAVLSAISLSVACRHAAPSVPLPRDWSALATGPAPFAALYRLTCCGRRDLLATVRFDGVAVDLLIAAQPGATLERAWVTSDGGWILDGRSGCVGRLPAGELPLARGRSLPLDPELIASLLMGRLPLGASPLRGALGWVAGVTDGFAWRARVVAGPTRVATVVVARPQGRREVLEATLDDYRPEGIPGHLRLRAGETLDLALVSWQRGGALAAPTWIDGPPCGTGS